MMSERNRVFLDANVVFSAAYRLTSRLNSLWLLQSVELVTSYLAAEEARRNLRVHKPDALARLESLLDSITTISISDSTVSIPDGIVLAEKDVHILAGAISSGCTHLITGDNQHFGHLFGHTVSGVKVVTPAQYLLEAVNIRENESG
jgi:predicted nucleic acid-binding protein